MSVQRIRTWRRMVCMVCAFLLCCSPALAAYTVFEDDFASADTKAWNITGPVSVMAVGGQKALTLDVSTQSGKDKATAILRDGYLSDYTMETSFAIDTWFADSWLPYFGVYLRYVDDNNYYNLRFRPIAAESGGAQYEYQAVLLKCVNGQFTPLTAVIIAKPQTGIAHPLKITVRGGEMAVQLDGQPLLSAADSTIITGKVGVVSYLQKVGFSKIAVTCDEIAGWSPIATSPAIAKESAMDLSFLQDKPAGKYGYIQIDDSGDYYFEQQPGQRVTFYGTNSVGSWSGGDPTKAEAEQIADRIAAMGYNLVRFHANDIMTSWSNGIYDRPTSNQITLNAEKLDVLDYMIYLLKARGIYINVDIMAYADFDGVPSLSGYGLPAAGCAALFPDGMALWKQMASLWLTHVNPYTGMALKDDPVLVGISPWNESLLHNLAINDKLKAWYLTDVNQFLTERGKQPITSIPGRYWDAYGNTAAALTEYFTYKTLTAYDEMKRYLQETVGVHAPIGGLNYMNDALVTSWRTRADVQETHLYNGLVDGRGQSFVYKPSAHPRYSTMYDSSTDFSQQSGAEFRNYIPFLAVGQLYHKPFALTEFNQEWPTSGRGDLGLISAAVGAYNSWDVYNRFDFTTMVRDAVGNRPLGGFTSFDTVTDPISVISEYQANLLVQRGHITPAETRFVIVRDKNWAESSGSAVYSESSDMIFKYLPHLCKVENVYVPYAAETRAVYKVTPDLTPEQIAAGNLPVKNKIAITNDMTMQQAAETLVGALDDADARQRMLDGLKQGKLISETGEMVFDLNRSAYLVHTPYMAGAAGSIADAELALGDVTVSGCTEKGTVTVSALDNQPLCESGRMLVLYSTEVQAASEKQVENGTSVTYYRGSLPTLAKQASGQVRIRVADPNARYAAYRLDMSGNRVSKLDVAADETGITIPLQVDCGFGFEIVQEHITFYQGDRQVQDISALQGGQTVTAVAPSPSEGADNGDCWMVLACYCQNELKTVVSAKLTDLQRPSVSMQLPDDLSDGCTIRAFLWRDTMRPLITSGVLK